MTNTEERSGAAYVLEPGERDTILAALRLWQGDSAFGRVCDELRNLATNDGAHSGLTDKKIDVLCEYLNFGPTQPAPVALSECCHAEIGWDAWVNSNGEVNGGPFDHNICTNCSMESPPVWDGKMPPWPRSDRQGNADLPEGVDEPPDPAAPERTAYSSMNAEMALKAILDAHTDEEGLAHFRAMSPEVQAQIRRVVHRVRGEREVAHG